MYFRSTNAQSPVLQTNGTQRILSYITTGGNLDINFFFRGSAKDVIASYQKFIGLPSLPPFWALGWHSSGHQLSNVEDLKQLLEGYQLHKTPLEGIHLHANYQKNYSSFTIDANNFGELKNFTEELQKNGSRIILDLSGGLSNESPPNKYRIYA